MEEKISEISGKALHELGLAGGSEALEGWRLTWLSRRGELSSLLSRLRDVPAADRPRIGQEINRLKESLWEAYEEK
jgi:phenylalanyl-tRNA synthetase alpha chain